MKAAYSPAAFSRWVCSTFFFVNNFPPICTVHNGKSHHMFLHPFACRKCLCINTHIVNETQQWATNQLLNWFFSSKFSARCQHGSNYWKFLNRKCFFIWTCFASTANNGATVIDWLLCLQESSSLWLKSSDDHASWKTLLLYSAAGNVEMRWLPLVFAEDQRRRQ